MLVNLCSSPRPIALLALLTTMSSISLPSSTLATPRVTQSGSASVQSTLTTNVTLALTQGHEDLSTDLYKLYSEHLKIGTKPGLKSGLFGDGPIQIAGTEARFFDDFSSRNFPTGPIFTLSNKKVNGVKRWYINTQPGADQILLVSTPFNLGVLSDLAIVRLVSNPHAPFSATLIMRNDASGYFLVTLDPLTGAPQSAPIPIAGVTSMEPSSVDYNGVRLVACTSQQFVMGGINATISSLAFNGGQFTLAASNTISVAGCPTSAVINDGRYIVTTRESAGYYMLRMYDVVTMQLVSAVPMKSPVPIDIGGSTPAIVDGRWIGTGVDQYNRYIIAADMQTGNMTIENLNAPIGDVPAQVLGIYSNAP